MYQTLFSDAQLEAVSSVMVDLLSKRGPMKRALLYFLVNRHRNRRNTELDFLTSSGDCVYAVDLVINHGLKFNVPAENLNGWIRLVSHSENTPNEETIYSYKDAYYGLLEKLDFIRGIPELSLSPVTFSEDTSRPNMHLTKYSEAQLEIVRETIVDLLERRGPISSDLLAYMVDRKKRQGNLALDFLKSVDNCKAAIKATMFQHPDQFSNVSHRRHGFRIHLSSQPENMRKFIEPFNYKEDYYELLEKLEAIQGNPELAILPDSFLDRVLGFR